MPDDWSDDFDGDWDLAGDEMVLDDELEFEEGFGLDGEESFGDDWGTHGSNDLDADVFDDGGVSGGFTPASASVPGLGSSGGGGASSDAGSRGPRVEERMSWSAWDVGTVFALGGWMLDQHAEQVGREVRKALAASSAAPAAQPELRGAPHPPPPNREVYGSAPGVHRVGDRLHLDRLYTELATARSQDGDLLLQAEGQTSGRGRLVLVVSGVPRSAGPSLWVVAEQHPGGFAASRLVPVFQADASGAFAVFATDHATEAVDAVAWACGREGIKPSSLTVARRA